MTHDILCLGCNCEDGDHWIDCACRCATINKIREQIANEIMSIMPADSEDVAENYTFNAWNEAVRQSAAIARGKNDR